MNDHDVREMLRRRAGDAAVDPDAWARITERVAHDEPRPAVREADPRHRGLPGSVVLGAIAAVLLVLIASVAALRDGDDDRTVRAADDTTPAPAPDREPGVGTSTPAAPVHPIWPATTDEGLARLQADADAGRRPDLLDPRAVAGAYLSERLADDSRRLTQEFAVGDFAQGDTSSGEVPYAAPPGGQAGGTVLVRQAGGDGAIWFVVGATSPGVDVHVAAYDGSDLTGEAAVIERGLLDIRIAGTGGSDPAIVESRAVAPGTPIDLRHRFAAQPGVIVQLRLSRTASNRVSLAEFRVDRLPTGGPPPVTPSEAAYEVAAEAAARQWIAAVASDDADRAWELLADDSRRAVGGRAGFEARSTELAEGWGAWDSGPDVSFRAVAPVDAAGDDPGVVLPASLPRLAVVIISGRVTQEGTTAFRTVSLPVRATRDTALVEPFADVVIEFDPVEGARLGPRTALGAFTPAGARVWFLLDDRQPVGPEQVDGADGDQQHATVSPEPALTPGPHALTVVVLTVDGRLASRSATYTVA